MISQLAAKELDAGTEELVLRICGTARDGQVVRLKSEKCIIGSGPRCTLRLRARGVHPVHCMVLRGRQGMLIRRWAPDTRLNGRPFSDAPLAEGDRIGIGPIELEVMAQAAGILDTPATKPEERCDDAERAEAALPAQPACEHVAALEGERTALEADDRRSDQQKEESEARPGESQQLESLRADLETQSCQLEHDRENLRAQRAEAEEELRRQVETLERRRREIEAGYEELRQQREAWGAERQEAEARLAERAKELAEEPLAEEMETSEEVSDIREPVPAPQPPPGPHDSGEETVDQYMARLLERVGARESSSVFDPNSPDPAPETSDPEPAAPEPETEQPVMLSSRAEAPDRNVNLSATRKPANSSAQTAIDEHFREELTWAVTSKLIVALVGLFVAACLICLWWTNAPDRLTLYAVGLSIVVAVLWGLQSFLLGRRLRDGQPDHLVNGDVSSAVDGLPTADAPPEPNGE